MAFPTEHSLVEKPAVLLTRQRRIRGLLLSTALLSSSAAWGSTTSAQSDLISALQNTPASGIVLDVRTGKELAAVQPSQGASRSAPGSILKPLFLAGALKRGEILPGTSVFCRRDLQINDGTREWRLACTHPQSDVSFTAQDALAYSCNRYFASLADRISPVEAVATLAHYGLAAQAPQNQSQKELLVLGLSGIAVTPMQVAAAYRKLALELDDHVLAPVRKGLEDSVRFGMAHNADVQGIEIAGKTGTVNAAGWFAGIGKFHKQNVVIVVYLPRGNGADAAGLAQHFFLGSDPPAPESARTLTVELWSARSITRLTAIPLSDRKNPVEIEWQQDGLHLSQERTLKQLQLSGRFRLQASGAPEIEAAGIWSIEWQSHGLRILLTLPSEDYVIAALNGEAAPDEPMASLKAMAISMRTFALVNANRHRAEGFGLCDSTHCQALRLSNPRPEVVRAVRETAGETLWSGGLRAHIYYTQHCGGMSESASVVWPAESAAYLHGDRADPYCVRRSPAEWHTQIPLAQLSQIFRDQGWRIPAPIGAIRVVRRSAAGRAQLLEVTGRGAPAQLSASSFRFAVDRALGWNQMRSDWYEVTVSGPVVQISGKGYGHGVGLCQAGAYEMAVEGHSAEDILRFYFPGTEAAVALGDHGWKKVAGAGWTLLTTDPARDLLAEGNAAWSKARLLLGGPEPSQDPLVQELPTTELFRQTTGEPGWMLASTRGSDVFLQPASVRQKNGGTEPVLLHEFLHVLVEQQAGEKAPLWLREGLVEVLANPKEEKATPMDLPPAAVDVALAHPAGAAESRHAHQVAARMAASLRARYGMPTIREFLHNGVPSEALMDLKQ